MTMQKAHNRANNFSKRSYPGFCSLLAQTIKHTIARCRCRFTDGKDEEKGQSTKDDPLHRDQRDN